MTYECRNFSAPHREPVRTFRARPKREWAMLRDARRRAEHGFPECASVKARFIALGKPLGC